jgi:hypothetical protein
MMRFVHPQFVLVALLVVLGPEGTRAWLPGLLRPAVQRLAGTEEEAPVPESEDDCEDAAEGVLPGSGPSDSRGSSPTRPTAYQAPGAHFRRQARQRECSFVRSERAGHNGTGAHLRC